MTMPRQIELVDFRPTAEKLMAEKPTFSANALMVLIMHDLKGLANPLSIIRYLNERGVK